MNCVELARTFLFWRIRAVPSSGRGRCLPDAGPADQRLNGNSEMYQNAGEFARRVGLPAKLALAVGSWRLSPRDGDCRLEPRELDETGNSGGRSGAGNS